MNLVKIAHIDNYFKLEMIRTKLLAVGIQSYAYDGLLPTHGITDYQLQVIESDVEIAQEIVKSFEMPNENNW